MATPHANVPPANLEVCDPISISFNWGILLQDTLCLLLKKNSDFTSAVNNRESILQF